MSDTKIQERYKWRIALEPYDFTDKKQNVLDYIQYMLMRTRQMFKYDGLPESIPENILESYLQLGGVAVITEVNDALYVFQGGWGGEPDAYYRPTKFVVANPYLKFNKTLTIGEDCVLIYNDSQWAGLKSLFLRYATALVENDLTINMADIMARVTALLAAGDDRSMESAKKFLEDIIAGKPGIIGNNAVLDSIKTLPFTEAARNSMTDLIELHQYLKAGWFNELGLKANYNMKREAINSDEAQLGTDSLLPLADDMLHSRQAWCKAVNAMYGTNITVDYHSSWKHLNDEMYDVTPEEDTIDITNSNIDPEDAADKSTEVCVENRLCENPEENKESEVSPQITQVVEEEDASEEEVTLEEAIGEQPGDTFNGEDKTTEQEEIQDEQSEEDQGETTSEDDGVESEEPEDGSDDGEQPGEEGEEPGEEPEEEPDKEPEDKEEDEE